jgi:tRNA A-37 threonylcarbamoyl transferase component Bud32
MKIKMLNEERKKEKEIEKRERLLSTSKSPLRVRVSSKNSSEDQSDSNAETPKQPTSILSTKNAYAVAISTHATGSNANTASSNHVHFITFRPFEIEFFEPRSYKINCIKLLNHNPEFSFSVYRGIEMNTQQIFTVYEWKLSLEKNKIFEKKKLDACNTEMHKLEEEFKRLNKLSSSLLVKYVAYKYYKETNKNLFVVQICLEYVEGNTLELFLNKNQSYLVLDSTLQSYAIQLLDALESLHSNHLYHRDLKPSSVYIEKNGTGLKLADYCLVKKVNNLNEVVANDAINLVQGNLKSDMHQLGLLLLSLRLGELVSYAGLF